MKKLIPLLFFVFLFAGCGGNAEEQVADSQVDENTNTQEEVVVEEEEKTEIEEAFVDRGERARDAARLGQMSIIMAALEKYNAEKGAYPKNAGCIGSGELFGADVNDYFESTGEYPTDPAGKRSGLKADFSGCMAEGKYFYKYVGVPGEGEYFISTVMEDPANNNVIGDSIDDIDAKEIMDNWSMCPESSCDFYVSIR